MERDPVVGEQLVCPWCGHSAHPSAFDWFALPPQQAGYVQVYRCPQCRKIFGPEPAAS